jgi:hypothetical protein
MRLGNRYLWLDRLSKDSAAAEGMEARDRYAII